MKTDLAVIGSGPAGLAAADTAAAYGLDVTIIDEQPAPGGQIFRRPPQEFTVPGWMNAKIYRPGKLLLQRVTENQNINRLQQTVVLGITRSEDGLFLLSLNGEQGMYRLQARSVLIASGCYDMPVIFPGWTLPGVMSAGGIQTFVKSQQLVPGERFLFAGTHPLQLVVADQIVQAGGKVAGVLFAQRFSRGLRVLRSPSVMLRHADKLLFIAGIVRRLRRAGVPVRFGETLVRANGDDALQSVEVAPLDAAGNLNCNRIGTIECDRLGVCFSFLASTELARQCGADKVKARFQGQVAEARVAGEPSLILCPETFMNLSGASVLAARDFYKIEHHDLLVVCDDFALPLGKLRFRPKGSAGGQKGLADIIRRLGDQDIPRLRIGIGPLPEQWEAADFVLGKFTRQEEAEVAPVIERAVHAVGDWVRHGIEHCMNEYN